MRARCAVAAERILHVLELATFSTLVGKAAHEVLEMVITEGMVRPSTCAAVTK